MGIRKTLANISGSIDKTFADATKIVSSPQRTYQWSVHMPFFMGGRIGELVSRYCQDIKFGEYNLTNVTEMRHGARQAFFAGMMEINTVSLTYVAPSLDVVSDFFLSWRDKIVSPRGFYGIKSEYAKDVFILLEDTSGIPMGGLKLKNAFPITFPSYDLSYGTEDVVRLTIEFRIDSIESKGLIRSLFDLNSRIIPKFSSLAEGAASKLSSFL